MPKNYSNVTLKSYGNNFPEYAIGVDTQGTIIKGGTTVSGGLYASTADSSPVTGTVETSLIGSGQGSLSVPANGFQVGDSFSFNMAGHLTSTNGDELTIKIQFNGVDELVIGPLSMPNISDLHWEADAFFTIRSLGASGSIMSSFRFTYEEDASDKFSGTAITQASTLNTTTLNTLDVVASWNTVTGVSIYSEIFNLRKIY